MQPDRIEPKRISARGVDRDFLLYYEKQGGRNLDPLRQWITQQKVPNQSQVLLGLKLAASSCLQYCWGGGFY